MRINKFLFISIVLLFGATHVIAQKTPATAKTQKFKAPKLYTHLGNAIDSIVTLTEAEAENIIALPLKVVDDKKNVYSVTSYQFLYNRRVVTEDEMSGKVTPTSSIASSRFTSTPLPQLWVNQVREQLKSGEYLYFFDVIAKDAQGRVMYASTLKIMVK